MTSTWAAPRPGITGRSTSRSSALSNTSRQRCPSASSRRRTKRPASAGSHPEPPSGSAAASATAARPACRLSAFWASTQATSRQPFSSLARAYAAASCVLPTPGVPVSKVTRSGRCSCASRAGLGRKPGGCLGILPTTTWSRAGDHSSGERSTVMSSSGRGDTLPVTWSGAANHAIGERITVMSSSGRCRPRGDMAQRHLVTR